MGIIKAGKKGRHLNSIEKYYIYRISRNNLQMNDIYINAYDPIFETLHAIYARWQHIHPPSKIYKWKQTHKMPIAISDTHLTSPTA
jgi:hypothetical protein